MGLNRILRAATQEQVEKLQQQTEKLEMAIQDLSEVDSSVPDSAFEAGSSNTQHYQVASGGTGYQNNNGGSNTVNFNGQLSGSTVHGGITFNGFKSVDGTE
ncbi:uncharacterized protein N7483_010191 [Penicillium malachiteum]|uniref:uncharacterized protein n=1 Tax=Penicillium malachiteum TaxID=1324776 RepID=UPI00254943BE|nr:uncharacterized protein N7483_010191 [Penicillium malachiteum]KAJ5713010.1 hypothetical protein N7483_010191 [Penicillium malachiteum]